MARPTKKGLDYFPLDVNFLSDIKVRRIVKACGSESVHILIALLAYIYRDDGYHVRWNDDIAFLVADEVGTKEGSVVEVTNKALQVNFFDKDMFDNYNILTSKGIQDRYVLATKERKEVVLEEKYLLTKEVNRSNIIVMPRHNSVNGLSNTQRKEKESKEKKSNKDSPKSRKRIYDESSDYYQLSLHLYQKINQDTAAKEDWTKQPNYQNWTDDIRKLVELDGKAVEKVRKMIDWCQGDNFWKTNILSAQKLRDHFEKMEKQAKSLRAKKTVTRKEILPDWKEVTEEEMMIDPEVEKRAQAYIASKKAVEK